MASPAPQRSSQRLKASRRFGREAQALGDRVRYLRHRRGWTLEEAAERMDLDLKHLQKVEAGQLNVTLVTLLRLADGFDEPIGFLFRRPSRAQ
jgi:transcriptional regulator with XRE-family HTH domain